MFFYLQIQNLEREIQEKRRQMRVLEQRIVESGEASVANASMVEMQQVIWIILIHMFLSTVLNCQNKNISALTPFVCWNRQ